MPQDSSKAPRPQDVQDTLADYLAVGVPKSRALKLVGVSPETYAEWLDKAKAGEEPYVAFKKAIDARQHDTEVEAMRALRHHMKRNWMAAKAYLEMISPETYDKKVEKEDNATQTVVQIFLPENGRKNESD